MTDKPAVRDLLKSPVLLLAFGFGSGLSGKAPGTAGTLVAMLLLPLFAGLPLWGYLLILLLAFLLGIYLCDRASKMLGVHDHGGIVWDEFVGYWLTMVALPFQWQWMLAGFCLFRLFDILKPWPIKALDRKIGGGFGIMVDDVVAGLFSWVILFGVYRLMPA